VEIGEIGGNGAEERKFGRKVEIGEQCGSWEKVGERGE
jgi:hypothetical protein